MVEETLINKEQEDANKKYNENIKLIMSADNSNLLQLSHENVIRAEVMIKSNSIYREKEIEQYFKDINDKLESKKNTPKTIREIIPLDVRNYNENLIYKVVCAVDNANSTHINSDKVGRKELTNRILEFKINEFYDNLENPVKKEFALLYRLAEKTNAPKGARYNISFASKFLQSACLHIYKDKNRDNYSKYDNVVKKVLRDYADLYKVECTDYDCTKLNYKNYKNYYNIIGNIIAQAKISRNGFDHLLWYYHKSNN